MLIGWFYFLYLAVNWGIIVKISLDFLVDEIGILTHELQHNIHFYDTKSTGITPFIHFEDFSRVEQIEKFVVYISKYKSNLFRAIPQLDGSTIFTITTLSNLINPYHFLYYTDSSAESLLKVSNRFSLNVRIFIDVLLNQNRQLDCRTIPEVIYDNQIPSDGCIPFLDTELTHLQKRNLNFFVDRLRDRLAVKNDDEAIKKVLKKTNAKFRDYSNYIDELFEQYGDLTFVCLELGLVSGLQVNFKNNKVLNLVELKTKLLNNARNVDPLSRAIGFVGKWEWSTVKGGLYFRIVFIFPTNDLGDMNALQLALNFYWCEEITHGQGLCHHAPLAAAPAKFKKSFCHIKASNQKERERFKERTIGYLTKSEKYYYPPELKHTLNDLLTEKTSDRELSLTFRSKSKK